MDSLGDWATSFQGGVSSQNTVLPRDSMEEMVNFFKQQAGEDIDTKLPS